MDGPLSSLVVSPDLHVPRSRLEPVDFTRVYREGFPFVWRCLRGLGVRDTALDDATQDVFVVVHRRLDTFRGDSSLRTWLYGIVRNVASNHRRRSLRKSPTDPLDPTLPSTAPGPLEQVEDAEAAAFVQDFVGGLDDKKRDVFVLVLIEELSIPEVAEMLSIPVNTAYTRLRSVRAEFRAALERRGDE
jgi:RNA polymerase sigma-70 factor (ECF subfamily)